MEKHHIAIGAVVLLVLAGGIYQGCLAGTAGTDPELVGAIDPPPMPPPPLIPGGDAGPLPTMPPTGPGVPGATEPPTTGLPSLAELPPGVPGTNPGTAGLPPDRCGGMTCAAGERCCPSTGECHPEGCTDCCPPAVPAPPFPGFVPPDEEPGRPLPGAAGEVPPPTMPTEPPGPGPDPPRP